VPGLHLHLLSDDRGEGGHLLECRPRRVRAQVQFIATLELALTMSLDYLTCDFRRDSGADLDKAER
jgi:acetolactate decarboxylase